MKKLLLETSIPKIYMLVMIAISILMLGCYFSYAMFTVQKEKNNAISIITGNLTLSTTVDGEEGLTLSLEANQTKTFTVTLSNDNDRRVRYNFYWRGPLISTNPQYATVGYLVEDGINIPPSETGAILEPKGSIGSSVTFKIKVENKRSNNRLPILLGYKIGFEDIDLDLTGSGSIARLFPEYPLTAGERLIRDYGNSKSITTYEAGEKNKMYASYSYFDNTDTYRYIGNIPNNYVSFNNEVWRIIGVFPYYNENNILEMRIKLIREESLGKYSYGSLSKGWAFSNLMKVLNPGYETDATEPGGSLYWNKQSGSCNLGTSESPTINCDFATTGLSVEAQNMIDDNIWYGGFLRSSSEALQDIYKAEYNPQWNWKGKVGLMSLSDYGYTYDLGASSCETFVRGCGIAATDSWLYKDTYRWSQWNINEPRPAVVSPTGPFYFNKDTVQNDIHPSVFLRNDIQLNAGTGTKSDPFIFNAP